MSCTISFTVRTRNTLEYHDAIFLLLFLFGKWYRQLDLFCALINGKACDDNLFAKIWIVWFINSMYFSCVMYWQTTLSISILTIWMFFQSVFLTVHKLTFFSFPDHFHSLRFCQFALHTVIIFCVCKHNRWKCIFLFSIDT